MKLKRFVTILIAGLILFSFFPNVKADPINDIARGLSEIISGAYQVLEKPLEVLVGDTSSSEWFMARVLFLLIIFSLVFVVLEKVPFFDDNKNRWALWIITISVSVLSIRWVGDSSFVQTILLPYSTLGIAVTAGLPFIFFFYLTKDYSTPIRKVSWIFFGIIFIVLWLIRIDEVGVPSIVYLITGCVAFFFFLFDGTIQEWKRKAHASNRRQLDIIKIRNQLIKEMNELRQAHGHLSPEEYSHWMRDIHTRARRWGIDPNTL